MRTASVVLSIVIGLLFLLPATASAGTEGTAKLSSKSYGPMPSVLAIPPVPVPPGSIKVPSPDIRVTNSPQGQNEVTVTINPVNPLNIVMGANDLRAWDGSGSDYWCGVYTTFNAGATWNMGLMPHTGALAWDYAAGDPSAAFDLNGNVYFTCLGFVRTNPISNNTISVTKSTDGGLTWGTPVAIVNAATTPPFHDKPYMAVDVSTASPYKNNVYVSWTNFTSSGTSPIYFSRSTNGGASFSTPMKISGTLNLCQGSQPSVGPNGEVYVSFLSYAGIDKLYVVKSTNGGATFGTPVFVSNVVDPGDLPEYRRTPTIPSSATDISSGPYSGAVYVVWQDGARGNHDVLLSYSRDGGATWSTAKRVNDDVGTTSQFFPFVSVSKTGRVDVVFYDRRNDPSDFLLDVYAGMSHDGGVTFRNKRITDKSYNSGAGQPFIGDYIGVASLDYSFYPGWCGFVGADTEIFTERTLALLFVPVAA